MTEKAKTWSEFSSSANPPYPRDGEQHIFSAKALIRAGEQDGQYIIQHSEGYIKLWESQMTPIADAFAEGNKKIG